VRARDAAGNLSAYSAVVSRVTSGDAQAPTAPTNLAANVSSGTQINLSWSAATDNVGVSAYLIERCQGAGCSTFTLVASQAATAFSDAGLTPATAYSYRVRATDATGNLSAYSSIAGGTTTGTPPPGDMSPPTAPTNPAVVVVSNTALFYSWAAATDNVGVTGYLVERCQGVGCSDFAQIGTPTGTSMSLTGLALGTSYSFRVRARDAAGNLSAYSAVVSRVTSGDTQAPTAPTNLLANVASGTQINVSWGVSTDNVGVTAYLVERCTGVGCSTFTQITSQAATTLSDTGLTPGTSYSYRVRATDATGYLSAYSAVASATTSAGPPSGDTQAPTAPTNPAIVVVSNTALFVTWTASSDDVGVTGYLVERCQGVGCSDFAQIGAPTGTAMSVASLAAGTSHSFRVRARDAAGNLSGYSPIATRATPGDGQPPTAPGSLVAQPTSTNAINLTWTASTDNSGVAGYRIERCQGQGCGAFVQVATSVGVTFMDPGLGWGTDYSYRVRAVDAGGNLSSYSNVAATQTPFDTQAPTTPTSLVANTASSSQINLSWGVSTDNVGVTSYLVERCQGASCSAFAQVTSQAATTLTDSGLAADTSYSYRVRASDLAGNLGGYSNVASATTSAGDVQAPSIPSGLAVSPVSNTSLFVQWTASTDNVAVTGYLVEQCQGVGCSDFAQVGTPTATSLSVVGLALGNSYSYRVRARDAAGNVSGYSAVASRVTYGDTQAPAAPGMLAASASSGSAINLTWTASTDNVSVTGYRIERCLGASCSSFAEVGTSTATSFSSSGLSPSTTYGFRVRAADPTGNLGGYSNVASATTTSDTTSEGVWSTLKSLPIVAVHSALLPNGSILMSDAQTSFGADARVWDPVTNATVTKTAPSNVFCGATDQMKDGRIIMVGGHQGAHYGTTDTNIFDPATSSWASRAQMAHPRWYPTVMALADGRYLVVGGESNCNFCNVTQAEVYDPTMNQWSSLGSPFDFPYYPHTFVLPNGKVFISSTTREPIVSQVLDVATGSWTSVGGAATDGGSAVMYLPGKVMKSGTSVDPDQAVRSATATTYVIDMNQTSPAPTWRTVAPMNYARTFHSLTVLPDGTVLATGGGPTTAATDTANGVLRAELWSPTTETWTLLPAMAAARLYHSEALLLPDGRVAVMGGGRFDDVTVATDQFNAQIYSPPYLFKGARPTITSAPATLSYGQAFSVQTPDAARITSVSLVRFGATTHSFNAGQRFVPLSFTAGGGTLTVTAPASANLAPGGNYMLFILDSSGVPSVAAIVHF
jgi:chitodextrinase